MCIRDRYAISAVVAWRQNNSLLDLWRLWDETLGITISRNVHRWSLTARWCADWMIELTKMDPWLKVYFTAVAFLHVAYKSSRHGLNDELLDILATLFGQHVCRRQYSNVPASRLSLDKAAKMMKVVANASRGTMSLIAIELSKAYLYRALRCKDSDSDSVYCLANVYLAVLYYTTGQYQTAIDHCTLVMRSQDHSQCSSHVVQGELLPKVDEIGDHVLGLAMFYQHVRTAALNLQCHRQHVSVFTTELFAHYLHIKCLSVTMCLHFSQKLSTDELKHYEVSINDTEQLFIGDVLLFLSLRQLLKRRSYHKPVCRKSYTLSLNPAEHCISDLVELLQTSAFEHLITFRQMEARDFGSVATFVTTDFEALYAYKRGDYQQCLQLSTQNVHTLLYAIRLREFPIIPEFIQLLDDDIVSLIALTVIVNPKCRDRNIGCENITQLTLSLYLMTQCQLKLRHTVTSLALTHNYIKVAHGRVSTLERLVLKMIALKALIYEDKSEVQMC